MSYAEGDPRTSRILPKQRSQSSMLGFQVPLQSEFNLSDNSTLDTKHKSVKLKTKSYLYKVTEGLRNSPSQSLRKVKNNCMPSSYAWCLSSQLSLMLNLVSDNLSQEF